jgi:hypothetical protein
MTPICQEFRESWLEALHSAVGPDSARAAGGHARECSDCASWSERVAAQARLIGSLPRLRALGELHPRVVAELHAGRREERAVAALRRLPSVTPPQDLEQVVQAELGSPPARVRAPDVLRRLVAEELSDPVQTRIRRQIGGLRRQRAPAELDARVAALASSLGGPAGSPSIPRRRAPMWISLAAGLLLLGGLTWIERARSEPRFSFKVVQVRGSGDLSPMARSLIDDLSGGMLGGMLDPGRGL